MSKTHLQVHDSLSCARQRCMCCCSVLRHQALGSVALKGGRGGGGEVGRGRGGGEERVQTGGSDSLKAESFLAQAFEEQECTAGSVVATSYPVWHGVTEMRCPVIPQDHVKQPALQLLSNKRTRHESDRT